MRGDQLFVWGLELKEDLARLNRHFEQLPETTKEQGVICFARKPPTEGEFLVSAIWDRVFPQWRNVGETHKAPGDHDIMGLMKEIEQKSKAPTMPEPETGWGATDVQMISVQRRVRRKKGSWLQVPKDLKGGDE